MKEVRDEVEFLHADKHQSFLQGDFNTLGIKGSYKVILSSLVGMIKHSHTWHFLKEIHVSVCFSILFFYRFTSLQNIFLFSN